MTPQQIKANAPEGATGYVLSAESGLRYIRKTAKSYFYKTTSEGRWWKVPITALRFIQENYKPL